MSAEPNDSEVIKTALHELFNRCWLRMDYNAYYVFSDEELAPARDALASVGIVVPDRPSDE